MDAGDARQAAREWDARYASGPVWTREPNPWVRGAVEGLPPGHAVDVAAGDGRHALWLASLGWSVTAVDVSLEGVRQGAALLGVPAGIDTPWGILEEEGTARRRPEHRPPT